MVVWLVEQYERRACRNDEVVCPKVFSEARAKPTVAVERELGCNVIDDSRQTCQESDGSDRAYVVQSPSFIFSESSRHLESDDGEDDRLLRFYQGGRAVKSEVKLLVKTADVGKEAIEIRSIREFVEDTRPNSFSRIFSNRASFPSSRSGSPQTRSASASPLPATRLPNTPGNHKLLIRPLAAELATTSNEAAADQRKSLGKVLKKKLNLVAQTKNKTHGSVFGALKEANQELTENAIDACIHV